MLNHAHLYLSDLLNVSKKDLLVARDRGGAVVLYKLIEGGELHHPKKILSSPVTENLEVLDIIAIPV